MKFIIFGPPGCGKGTQSKKIKDALHIKHISTGDLLREQNCANSALKRGELVSDECIYGLIKEQLHGPFILDGFPRNLNQCKMLEDITAAIYIELKIDTCVARALNRNEGREDDNREAIGRRMEIYAKEIDDMVDYFQQRGVLIRVDGDGTVDNIFDNIMKELNKYTS